MATALAVKLLAGLGKPIAVKVEGSSRILDEATARNHEIPVPGACWSALPMNKKGIYGLYSLCLMFAALCLDLRSFCLTQGFARFLHPSIPESQGFVGLRRYVDPNPEALNRLRNLSHGSKGTRSCPVLRLPHKKALRIISWARDKLMN